MLPNIGHMTNFGQKACIMTSFLLKGVMMTAYRTTEFALKWHFTINFSKIKIAQYWAFCLYELFLCNLWQSAEYWDIFAASKRLNISGPPCGSFLNYLASD
jgi:hypothetical protein